jgi:phage anti-repressor protein
MIVPHKSIKIKFKRGVFMKGLTVVENEMIPIYQSKDNEERLVNARDLYKFLEVKRQFADWIKDRINKYQFVEEEDYIHVSQKCETSTGATVRHEYILKMDTAKELAMVENNIKGRQIRKYFIEIDKRYKKLLEETLSREATRVAGIITRHNLTDAIKALPESPNKKWKYKQYTDLVYINLFGKTAKQIKKELNISKEANIREYLNTDQLKRVEDVEDKVRVLLKFSDDYNVIKTILFNNSLKIIAS